MNYTQNAACSFRNCPLRNCPFTSVHMKKDTRLFHTASDGKLGGAWELGYGLLCTCLYPESGELQAGATALGLYKHNDDTYYILPIQPRSQALAAFVLGNMSFVDKCLGHSLTKTHTPILHLSMFGVSISSRCMDIICKTMVLADDAILLHRGERKVERTGDTPPTLWRSCQRAWKSFSPFSSIILHSALSCSA